MNKTIETVFRKYKNINKKPNFKFKIIVKLFKEATTNSFSFYITVHIEILTFINVISKLKFQIVYFFH